MTRRTAGAMVSAVAPQSTPAVHNTSGQFVNTLVNGQPATVASLHQSLVDAAEAHIHARHRAPCSPKTKLLFARMDFHGVGNDLNNAVRAFAIALQQERQVVFLPPSQIEQTKNPWLQHVGVSWRSPWHWLHSAGMPFDSMIVPSSCQIQLSSSAHNHILRAVAEANDTDASITLERNGHTALAKISRSWHPIWRVGLTAAVMPIPFQTQGLLWWFQVLASYLLRARGPLRAALEGHEAMTAFRATPAGRETSSAKATKREMGVGSRLDVATAVPPGADTAAHFGRFWCGKRWCDDIGAGWHPHVWFDVGLHIRMGDVCGKNAPKRGQVKRKCSQRPLEDALELMVAHGLRGSVFFASDSAETLAQAAIVGPAYGFNITSLKFERGNDDHDGVSCATSVGAVGVTGLELCKRSLARDRALLVEALLDAFMLSRSNVLVGSMMSNFPRLALQLRVQAPVGYRKRYLALDGREWCTRTSCRMNYTERFGTA